MIPQGSRTSVFADIARALVALPLWLVTTLIDLVATAIMSPSPVPLRRIVGLTLLVVAILGVTKTVPVDWSILTGMPTPFVR